MFLSPPFFGSIYKNSFLNSILISFQIMLVYIHSVSVAYWKYKVVGRVAGSHPKRPDKDQLKACVCFVVNCLDLYLPFRLHICYNLFKMFE